MDWRVKSVSSHELEFEVDFEHPFEVSHNPEKQDLIEIEIDKSFS